MFICKCTLVWVLSRRECVHTHNNGWGALWPHPHLPPPQRMRLHWPHELSGPASGPWETCPCWRTPALRWAGWPCLGSKQTPEERKVIRGLAFAFPYSFPCSLSLATSISLGCQSIWWTDGIWPRVYLSADMHSNSHARSTTIDTSVTSGNISLSEK